MKPSTIITLVYLMACITTIVTLSGMSSNTSNSNNKFTDEESVNPNSTVSIQMYEYIER